MAAPRRRANGVADTTPAAHEPPAPAVAVAVAGEAQGEHAAAGGAATVNGVNGGVNGTSRRAQFGLHDEDDHDDGSPSLEEMPEARHGFEFNESEFAEEEQLRTSTWLPWTESTRFEKVARPVEPLSPANPEWRNNRERLRTGVGALVVCLRIGYDPPDVVKTEPCARKECWVDPNLLVKDKALEQIGKNLVSQYENLASTGRIRYRPFMDPIVDEARRIGTSTRKLAKHERVLFHYNGHGVPKPTPSGEIWLFNRQYTQYIPVSLLELIGWVGSPAIYVWDCSAAGNIVGKVIEFSARKDDDVAKAAEQQQAASAASAAAAAAAAAHHNDPPPPIAHPPFSDTIQLAACQAHQSLPMNPDLPADLFTSCLTSPIEMALTFFILRNPMKADLDPQLAFNIPGKSTDRKSPLGELSWIFTAVTDTIAWNTFPPSLFQRLFRHDLVVAALFRGFLLAERVMRHYDCTPISVPKLPATHNHPLWDSWDLAVDRCLAQLPPILANETARREAAAAGRQPPPEIPFALSRFFSDELQAFELWLEQGVARAVAPADIAITPASPLVGITDGTTRRHAVHPQQLPIVLQVLLSQAHRTRALVALCKFLDLGPWAVNLGLSIGIFPYVLKLLQAPTVDLKPLLIFIWARILGVFRGCQEDLIRVGVPAPPGRQMEPPFTYFVKALNASTNVLLIPNVSEHRAMCAFILAILCRDYRTGQKSCMEYDVHTLCLQHLDDIDPLLRQWSALCIAQLWNEYDEAKGEGIRRSAHERLSEKLTDEVPEVRAAVLHALSSLIGAPAGEKTRIDARSLSGARIAATDLSTAEQIDIELGVAMATLQVLGDGSPQVRRELVVLLSAIVAAWEGHLLVAAYHSYEEDTSRVQTGHTTSYAAEQRQRFIEQSARIATEGEDASNSPAFKSMIFSCIYKTLLDLASDPYPAVAEKACIVIDYIHERLLTSPLATARDTVLSPTGGNINRLSSSVGAATLPTAATGSMRRGNSLANAVKSLSTMNFTDLAGVSTPPSDTQDDMGSVSRRRPRTRSLRASSSVDSLLHAHMRRTSTPHSDDERGTVEDATKILIEADLERLYGQAESALPTTTPSTGPSSAVSMPLPPHDEALPLRSDFFDFCCRYFAEPQMKAPEAEEPGSRQYNARLWRRDRAERIIVETQAKRDAAGRLPWDEQIAFFANDTSPSRVLFHQFEPHLAASDSRGFVNVYNWQRNARISRFSIEAPSERALTKHSRISTLKFINEEDVAFLLAGSSDGNVRLFRNYDTRDAELVTAFRALTDILPSSVQEAGLIAEWQQNRGHLLIGGNVKHIRIWDAGKDASVQEIPTRASSCLTSLTSDQMAGNVLVGGFGDGIVRVYDRRAKSPREMMSLAWRAYHHAWIQEVHMQRGGNRELLSGSRDGVVCMWDIRMDTPLRIQQAHQGDMLAMAVHDQAPVYATGSAFQVIKVWNVEKPEPISKFRNSTSYHLQKTIPVSCMAFHPHRALLAAGAEDGHLNVYRCDTSRRRP